MFISISGYIQGNNFIFTTRGNSLIRRFIDNFLLVNCTLKYPFIILRRIYIFISVPTLMCFVKNFVADVYYVVSSVELLCFMVTTFWKFTIFFSFYIYFNFLVMMDTSRTIDNCHSALKFRFELYLRITLSVLNNSTHH